MAEEKVKKTKQKTPTTQKEDKVKTSLYVKCIKCGENKFCRKEVYDKRVLKFGSIDKMNKEYLCRKCKKCKKLTK